MSRKVVIRSGGVGDFVLTIPLLKALAPVTLVTRRAYAQLVAHDGLYERWLDIDSAMVCSLFASPDHALAELVQGAKVITFLNDDRLLANLRALGAREVIVCESRPTEPPHIVERMFQAAGLPVPVDLLETAFLRREPTKGTALWLHPGSGSPRKNASFDWFSAQAEGGEEVIVSFGEADEALMPAWRDIACERVTDVSLAELRHLLTSRAARFVGNDTGITHLAAALGIPTTAAFVSTNPVIWRPLGQVQICTMPGDRGMFVSGGNSG